MTQTKQPPANPGRFKGGGYQNVEGDLKSVWEKLTGESEHPRALDEHLTWTRRDPKVD